LDGIRLLQGRVSNAHPKLRCGASAKRLGEDEHDRLQPARCQVLAIPLEAKVRHYWGLQEQAKFEFEDAISDWIAVPPDEKDVVAFALSR
jgi:hypothetical protein